MATPDFFATCRRWIADRGFGFCDLPDGRSVFVHSSVCMRCIGMNALTVGEQYGIDIELGHNGLRATRIEQT